MSESDKIPRWENWPHVLKMQQFSRPDLERIVEHASLFQDAHWARKKLPRISREQRQISTDGELRSIRTLFYEPSTRTEATFVNAAQLLNCHVHPVQHPQVFSSAVKGESLRYAVAAYSCGCDGIVMRHKKKGASKIAADVVTTIHLARNSVSPFFVINAGDGKGQHPTQSLVDLTTIFRFRGRRQDFLKDVTVLFPGDLRRNRVVNSLLYALGKFPDCNIKALFCCPEGAAPKPGLLQYLVRHNVSFEFVPVKKFQKAIERSDVIEMTRLQRERINKKIKKKLDKFREMLVFRKEYLDLLKPGAFVIHPLPINEDPDDPPPEIDSELMSLAFAADPRCAWVDQSFLGLSVRAALLDFIFSGIDRNWHYQNAA